jgi:hypothetical protein
MKAILFISAFFTLGTAILGWMNRSAFAEHRKEKDDIVRETQSLLTSLQKGTIAKIGEVKTQWQDAKKSYETDKYSRDKEIKETKDADEETKGMVAKAEDVKKEVDTMVTNFNNALQGLGITKPEELGAKRDGMKAEVQALNEELAAKDKEIEVLNSVLAENTRQLTKQSEVQTQRSKGIALDNQEGLITAVNQDFGFVIINLGQSAGVTPESRLLVKRGIQLVGKLKLRDVRPNLTVADIDYKSIKSAIQPGDQVIFDSAN